MLTINVSVDTRDALDYLGGMAERAANLAPVLKEIGVDLVESTQKRFSTATAPDGAPWAPKSAVTLMNYSRYFAGVSKKPLTGPTKALQTTINFVVNGPSSVSIGSPMVYAATMQYGAQQGEFGLGVYKTRNGAFPIPWGDIPARPFLGLSDDDHANVIKLVRSYLLEG